MSDETHIDSIAAVDVDINGSVHAPGEARVHVERLHTPDGERMMPIRVHGSVHGVSHATTNVANVAEIRDEDVPDPAADASGFTNFVSDRRRVEGDYVDIGSLYVLVDRDPKMFKSLGAHFDTVEELSIRADVHDSASIAVDIGDMYVIE